ncbi:MAG: hypothetical protein AB7S38_10620 [Vulcanimicrobiota bacterium]
MSGQLEHHLAELRQQGEFDSEGFFTIDLKRGQRLTLDLLRAQPFYWLVKLVQAAVRLGAPAVQIRNQAHTTHLAFATTQALPPASRLASTRTTELSESFVATMARQHQHYRWTVLGEHSEWLTFGNEQSHHGRIDRQEADQLRQTFGLGSSPSAVLVEQTRPEPKVGFWARVFARGCHAADETRELCHACCLCPIPVYLDGRNLATGRAPYHPIPLFGLYEAPGGFRVDPQGTPFDQGGRQLIQEWVSRGGEAEPGLCRLALTAPEVPGGPQIVWFVGHGVLLHGYRADLGYPGAAAIVDLEGLKTDATSMQVVRDEAFDRLLHHLRERLAQTVRAGLDRAAANQWLGSRALRTIEERCPAAVRPEA